MNWISLIDQGRFESFFLWFFLFNFSLTTDL